MKQTHQAQKRIIVLLAFALTAVIVFSPMFITPSANETAFVFEDREEREPQDEVREIPAALLKQLQNGPMNDELIQALEPYSDLIPVEYAALLTQHGQEGFSTDNAVVATTLEEMKTAAEGFSERDTVILLGADIVGDFRVFYSGLEPGASIIVIGDGAPRTIYGTITVETGIALQFQNIIIDGADEGKTRPKRPGIHVEGDGDLVIDGAVIRNGAALPGGVGGGIYISGEGSATLRDVTVTGCRDTGVYHAGEQNLFLENCTISGNRGGGVYSAAPLVVGEGTVISANSSERGGAGVFALADVIVEKGARITGNTNDSVQVGGGGIYAASGATLTISGEISGNVSVTTAGGGADGNTIELLPGAVISGNHANQGGGLNVRGGLTAEGALLEENTASQDGGGIYIAAGAEPGVVEDTVLTANTAAYNGGGVWAGTTLSVSGTEISFNRANGGGGIYMAYREGDSYLRKLEDTGLLTMTGSTVEGNVLVPQGVSRYLVATRFGAGVALNDKGGIISDTVFTANDSASMRGDIPTHGAAIGLASADYDQLTLTRVSFNENVADYRLINPVRAEDRAIFEGEAFADVTHDREGFDFAFNNGEITYTYNYTVRFYLDSETMLGSRSIYNHGDFLDTGDVKGFEERLQKDFHDWDGFWYLEPECETAFDPAEPITGDLDLFPGWISKEDEIVTVRYVDEDGNPLNGFSPVEVKVGAPYGGAIREVGHIARAKGWALDGVLLGPDDLVRTGTDHALVLLLYDKEYPSEFYSGEGDWDYYDGDEWNPEDTVRRVTLEFGPFATMPELSLTDPATGRSNTGWYHEETGYWTEGRHLARRLTDMYPVFGEIEVRFETSALNAIFHPLRYPLLTDESLHTYDLNLGIENGNLPSVEGITRPGYTLDERGWFLDPEDETSLVDPGASWAGRGDHTLYLRWLPDSIHPVVFFGEYGGWVEDGELGERRYLIGHGETLPDPGILRRADMLCIGWRDSSGREHLPGVGTVKEPLDLYPIWEPVNNQVVYHTEGGVWVDSPGEEGPVVKQVAHGAFLPDPGTLRKNNGIRSIAWQDAAGVRYIPGESYVEGPLTLYPVWGAVVFTVTLEPDGGIWPDGSGEPLSLEVENEGVLALPAIIRGDDTLVGWKDTATGNPFLPGETTVTANLILQPVWKEMLNIRMDIGEGAWSDGKMAAVRKIDDVYYGEVLTAPCFTPPKGHSLAYWYQRGQETPWNFEDPVLGGLDLVAYWVPVPADSCIVTFDPNGGSWVGHGNADTFSKVMEKGETIPFPEVAKEGYRLECWTTEEGAPWPEKAAVYSNFTLTASWAPTTRISFDTCGGEPLAPIYAEQGTPYGELPMPYKPGHTFLGWYDAQFGGRKVEEGSLVINGEDHILYARWTVLQVLLRFNWMDQPETGGHTVRNFAAEYGSRFDRMLVAAPVSSDAALNFAGWYTEPDGGKRIEDGDMITQNAVFYARWEMGAHTVTCMVGGDIHQTMTRNDGETLAKPAPPQAEGWVFDGWYIGDRKWNFDSDTVTGNLVLTARMVREKPAEGELGLIHKKHVAVSTGNEEDVPDWETFSELLEAEVIDATGRDVTEQAELVASNYHKVDFSRPGSYDVSFCAKLGDAIAISTVTVEVADDESPVITIKNRSISVEGGRRPSLGYLLARAGVSVRDNYDEKVMVNPTFQGITYEEINWKVPGEYVMLLDAADSAGNHAAQQRVIVMTITEEGADSEEDKWVFHNGGNSWTLLGEDGEPLGTYEKSGAQWLYIPENQTPPLALPNTGRGLGMLFAAAGGLLLAAAVLRRKGRRERA